MTVDLFSTFFISSSFPCIICGNYACPKPPAVLLLTCIHPNNNIMEALKLFTIGDSISQGFMSMAAARTDLSYSTIVAKEMGWLNNYEFPFWDKGGHPLNLELVFRKLTNRIGDRWEEWNPGELVKILDSVFDIMEEVEEFYERGQGRHDQDYTPSEGKPDYFHNVASRGFNVSDAWTVSHDMCTRFIAKDPGTATNDKRSLPSSSFFRTAARILSRLPQSKPQFNTFTAIDWLKYHATTNGVENVFLWLGANNVLSTVLNMSIKQTSGKLPPLPRISPDDNTANRESMYFQYQNQYNEEYSLWHADDFKRDYALLLEYVNDALDNAKTDTKVFIATVPFVTILPLARGMGQEFEINGRRYFEYYTYFPYDSDKLTDHPHLSVLRLSEVLFIENTIRTYNEIIQTLVKEQNAKFKKKPRFHIVDICTAMDQIAFRRNHGVPSYKFPAYINNRYPKPDTRYYERHPLQGAKGGLFSLDGVHPTAIGQGLIAHEFMKAMLDAGVKGIPTTTDKDGATIPALNWEQIYKDDVLYNNPIPLISDLFKHDRFKKLILDLSTWF